MSYDTVKNGLVETLELNSYAESEYTDFEVAPTAEHGSTFILTALSGNMNDETISDRFYDGQSWQVQVAFSKSGQNDIIDRDQANRKRDTLIQELDDPANWQSYVRMQKYSSWALQELKSYFLLTIQIKIIDQYVYS